MPKNSKSQKKKIHDQFAVAPIPPHYVHAATILRGIHEKIESLQDIGKLKVNRYGKHVHDAVLLALAHGKEIDYLIEKTKILQGVIPIDSWTLRILMAEVLWGKQRIGFRVQANEVAALTHFEETLRESFPELLTVIRNPVYVNRAKIPTYIRINTLSISLDDSISAFHKEGWKLLPSYKTYQEHLSAVSKLSGYNFIKDYHIPDLLIFPPGTSFYDHPGCLRGKFLIQDKGSCLSSFLLNPKPNSAVFDMCAAPGLKLNHLANIMSDTGVIYGTDHHLDRWTNLMTLLELTNVTCAQVVNTEYHSGPFQNKLIKYILVDHTTTNSGLSYYVKDPKVNPLPESAKRYSMSRLYEALQFALHKFPNVKRVVYTTCTIHAEEAEMVVDKVLDKIGDSYTLLDAREMLWNQWVSVGYPGYLCSSKCLRTLPEVDRCYCYFIAVFERNPNVPLPYHQHRVYTNTEEEYEQGADDEVEVEEIPFESSNNVGFNPAASMSNSTGNDKGNRSLNRMGNKGFHHKQFKKFGHNKAGTTSKPKQNASTTFNRHTNNRQSYDTAHSQLYP